MDLLTLTVLAEHEPDAVLMDDEGDLWHATCVLEYIGNQTAYFRRLIAGLQRSTDEGDCYVDMQPGERCLRGGRCKPTSSDLKPF